MSSYPIPTFIYPLLDSFLGWVQTSAEQEFVFEIGFARWDLTLIRVTFLVTHIGKTLLGLLPPAAKFKRCGEHPIGP